MLIIVFVSIMFLKELNIILYMEVKKVDVEIIGNEKKNTSNKIKSTVLRIKLRIAIIFDIIDFFIGWIPIVNTLWDFVTFIVLLIILKNKKLAFVSLIELPLLGLPPFSLFDMFIPTTTLIVLIDNSIEK
jgi:ATP-dependent protease Clp ATPase subunit